MHYGIPSARVGQEPNIQSQDVFLKTPATMNANESCSARHLQYINFVVYCIVSRALFLVHVYIFRREIMTNSLVQLVKLPELIALGNAKHLTGP